MDFFAVLHKLLIKHFEELPVRGAAHLLEQSVAFRQYVVVPDQGVEVIAVGLGYERVEPLASLVGGIVHQENVAGGDYDSGNNPNMIGQALVFLGIAFQAFARIALERAGNRFMHFGVAEVIAVEHEKFLAVAHTLAIGHSQGALTHGKVIYGVYGVGFSGPVLARQAVDARREFELGLGNVLKVNQRQFPDIHPFNI